MDAKELVVALLALLVVAGPVGAVAAGGGTGAGTGAGPISGAEISASSAAGVAQTECAFPVTEVDATGTEVTVEEAPERITVLGPSAAQTLWEIGAEERVVGLPHQYAGYLDGVESRTDVSGPGRSYVSSEAVVNTTPDLVLAPNIITNDTVSTLRDAGLTVYRFRAATTIQDVVDKTVLTGRLVGECEGADETVAWMDERIGAIRDAVADEPNPRVLVSMGGGFVAGSGTFVHEVVTAAGTENVAASAGVSGYRELSGETVVERDPEWIIQNGPFATYPKTAAYNSTTAVQSGQVLTVDPNHASQPAPRIVYAIENVTRAIHPDAYDAAIASLENESTTTTTTTTTEETTTATSSRTQMDTMETTTATATATDATASGGQPGFGVGVALVAVLGSALLRRRRE